MSDYPELQVGRLDQAYTDVVELYARGEWDQAYWRASITADGKLYVGLEGDEPPNNCKTKFCFAGTTVDRAGGVWINPPWFHRGSDHLKPESDDPEEDIYSGDHYQFVYAFARAQRLLGLTEEEADALFDHPTDIEELRDTIEAIKIGLYR